MLPEAENSLLVRIVCVHLSVPGAFSTIARELESEIDIHDALSYIGRELGDGGEVRDA